MYTVTLKKEGPYFDSYIHVGEASNREEAIRLITEKGFSGTFVLFDSVETLEFKMEPVLCSS